MARLTYKELTDEIKQQQELKDSIDESLKMMKENPKHFPKSIPIAKEEWDKVDMQLVFLEEVLEKTINKGRGDY